jgi:hypothetical protein
MTAALGPCNGIRALDQSGPEQTGAFLRRVERFLCDEEAEDLEARRVGSFRSARLLFFEWPSGQHAPPGALVRTGRGTAK